MNDKLLEIQSKLKAPKNQVNKFGGYNYRNCEDIFEAVKPLLKEQGLSLTVSDELLMIGNRYYIKATAKLSDGENVIENTAYAREEETKKGMDGSQITGASSSYARKYALNGLFLIDDVKDSDTTNLGEITKENAEKYVINFGKKHNGHLLTDVIESDPKFIEWCLNNSSDENLLKCIELLTGKKKVPEEELTSQIELITKMEQLILETGVDRDSFYEYFKVKTNREMTTEQMKEAIVLLEKKRDKNAS